MGSFDGVIFDWSGTLVHDPSLRDRVALTFARLGRGDTSQVDAVCRALTGCGNDKEVLAAQLDADTSSGKYYAAESLHFKRAGLDGELADMLLHVDEWPESRPLYPDARPTLQELKAQGCRILVLSDIHFNIRELLVDQGVGQYIDDYVLSFEHGVQKPDPKIFALALDRLGLPADRVLMVGDRSTHDGAAAESGIVSLLLPRITTSTTRGLSLVNTLVRGE